MPRSKVELAGFAGVERHLLEGSQLALGRGAAASGLPT